MSFVKAAPLFEKAITYLESPNRLETQIWQQFEMLRHLPASNTIKLPVEMTPWIDQAENYYKDAMSANWRTSGLLYYYSFLNIAKSYLIATQSQPVDKIKSTSVFHGLAADPQAIDKLPDFEIKIMPPHVNGKSNIFALFYESVSKAPWPFQTPITIKANKILPYCSSIGAELFSFYQIRSAPIMCRGMIRMIRDDTWYEICIPKSKTQVFLNEFPNNEFELIEEPSTNQDNINDWFLSFRIPTTEFNRYSYFRTRTTKILDEHNRSEFFKTVHESFSNSMKGFICPCPENRSDESWYFFPKINIGEERLYWHPVFSDYIAAFMLSTILRYQPHLFEHDDKNSYIAKAWCTQSSIDSLRHLLMFFTDPMVILN